MNGGGERAGLYVHVPFCSTVCPYCDFAVVVDAPRRRAGFVDALCAESRRWAGRFPASDTLYFGGGTPSRLDGDELGALVAALRGDHGLPRATWITLEANPEDVTPRRLRAWRAAGVCTVSLGVQALDDAELAFLGRAHDVGQAERSVRLVREAGFATVSLDLIYGLPGQRAGAWRRTLERAVALRPHHLSCYQLTVHEGTAFARERRRGALAELADDDQAALFLLTHAVLSDAGYPGYEVSNFARDASYQSRHNRKYWQHVPYLGLGPSAHSLLGRHRWWNERGYGSWRTRAAAGADVVVGDEQLDDARLALEMVFLGLRTRAGVDLGRLRRRTGVDLVAANRATLSRFVAHGLVEIEASRLRATRRGWAVVDALARELDVGVAEPAGGVGSRHPA